MKDKLFAQSNPFGPEGFIFDARVSQVFDDMVSRSVPGYSAIQLLVADMAVRFAGEGVVYDLGCSTGNTLLAILKRASPQHFKLVGIDSSKEMLEQCRDKLLKLNLLDKVVLDVCDINSVKELSHGSASVIILNLVLQFIDPEKRESLIKKLCEQIKPGGVLILVEKTIQSDEKMNDLFIDYYHQYKKEMGYSALEISKKREALENRLIPFSSEQNRALLQKAGFSTVTSFFQWINFEGYLGVK